MRHIGLKLFGGAIAVALVVHGLTQPDGLPWGIAGRLPHAWLGTTVAAGFVATLFNRHFGWRVGIAAALGWTFFPNVWNAAVLGERLAAYAAFAAVAIWLLDGTLLVAFGKARKIRRSIDRSGHGSVFGASENANVGKRGHRAAVAALVVSVVFALLSIALHDYHLGSAATAYARGVVESAGDRIIVLNGVCDRQVVGEVRRRKGGGSDKSSLSDSSYILPNSKDPEYLNAVVEWARREWPAETNLAVAARVGVRTFLGAAVKAHPERFYVMNGGSETFESWEMRWRAFAPYLKSEDRFVRIGRLAFAYEANGVANAMREVAEKADDDGSVRAWRLYWRILNEIDRSNIAAFVNLSEMVRLGYKATDRERKLIKNGIDGFFGDTNKRRHAKEFISASGPVKSDPELVARLTEERCRRIEEARAAGKKLSLSPEAEKIVEMNNAMVKAVDEGDLATAGRLARKILSDPRWRGFVPANAVMGTVVAKAGDYVAAEVFFRTATSGTNSTPASVWNDYADTLMHLGKLDEAERMVRKAMDGTDEKNFVPRITLAEILSRKVKQSGDARGEMAAEARALIASVLTNAPPAAVHHIRASQAAGDLVL